jgi:hypothetical protein
MAKQHSSVLSPLDQYMPRTYTRIFLVFALEHHDAAIEALRLGLLKTYVQLPCLKGYVFSKSDDKNQLSIAWSDDDPAPEFLENWPSECLSFANLSKHEAALHHFQASLCPIGVAPDHSNPDSRAAVFAASYSRIDRGLILALGVHHFVMDGMGVGQLVRVIATATKLAREETGLVLDPLEPLTRVSKLQTFESSHRGEAEVPDWETLLQRHPEFSVIESSPKNTPIVPTFPKGTSKIFRFPVDRLDMAKEVLNNLASPDKFTTNTVLTAVIWSIITRIRFSRLGLDVNSQSNLGFAINGRKHLSDDFFRGYPYFGNVNLFGRASINYADIYAASQSPAFSTSAQTGDVDKLLPVTTAVSTAVARISPSHISEVIRIVQGCPDLKVISQGWRSRNGPDLTLTSWANMGLYECDFGDSLGEPQYVRVPYAEFDGLVIILPRRRKGHEAAIEAVVMLSEVDMATIERDIIWQSWTI